MCGRYASAAQARDLVDAFALAGYDHGVLFGDETLAMPASWNIAPGQDIPIIVDRPLREERSVGDLLTCDGCVPDALAPGEVRRQVRRARWGLVPSWAKDPRIGSRMINARSETIFDKPAFRAAISARRCLIPASGYYEWQSDPQGGVKTPWFIAPADSNVMMFAGVYEFWQAPDGTWLVTASVITTQALPEFAHIHDRRPVIVLSTSWDQWLHPDASRTVITDVLGSAPPLLTAHQVSREVGNVRNNGPHLITPLPGMDGNGVGE
ncbi:SOS response-associated peptidase [Jonesia quinghaiensis]|uniref:SOS response-associated peptidase n=1 Tax=Jonesia quinghaiensis TaxID=262806 RepID=UPI00048CE328|nr:SOS response-associated peptidase [Jonesia quinghaiensis]